MTAWQQGLLIFRDVPLARVIDEVNRYRPGRIIVVDPRLGRREVVADFRLDRLDAVVEFVAQFLIHFLRDRVASALLQNQCW